MDNETIEKIKLAGKITAQVREYGAKLIKKDSLMVEVLDQVEKKIFALGAKPAFPAQISCNSIAAHYCPEEDETFKFSDELVSLDVGCHIDGYIGDTAITVDLSGKYGSLLNASNEALSAAINTVKVGITLGEIGDSIQEAIQKYNFAPVRNLSGHGLGHYKIHTKPSFPNFNNQDKTTVKEGMHFAIEPFASNGAGIVQNSGNATVYELKENKPVRNTITRQVLKHIANYEGLPFCTRWLTKEFGMKAKLALREMEQLDMLISHPPLADKNKGMVSQAEHTILISESGEVIVTTKL